MAKFGYSDWDGVVTPIKWAWTASSPDDDSINLPLDWAIEEAVADLVPAWYDGLHGVTVPRAAVWVPRKNHRCPHALWFYATGGTLHTGVWDLWFNEHFNAEEEVMFH